MPAPANDNFANATVITGAGTLTGDNTDATSDGPDDPLVNVGGYGVHTVWYLFDSTSSGRLTIGTTAFDGSSIGDTVIGVYQGATLPGLVELDTDDDSGPGLYSQITDLVITGGDPIYIEVTGYDDSYEGTFTLTWSFVECLDAVDLINPDSPGATIVSGRVREPWRKWASGNYSSDGMEPTLKWTWAGAQGMYQMSVTGQAASTPNNGARVNILVRVNGRMFIGGALNPPTDGSSASADIYPGLIGASYNDDDLHPLWIPINTGDTVEVMVASLTNSGSPSFTFVPYEIETLCFALDADAPTSGTCTPALNWPTTPLGDVWGSPMGWGGQKFVPDEIFVAEGLTPYDESDYAWGINWADYDIAPTDSGAVYMAVHDETNNIHYIVVKKYDPGTDDWTQIATLATVADTFYGYAEAVSCEWDGTYVHVGYWDGVITTVGPPVHATWKWHLWRIDPSDDSATELGTGQNKYGVVTQTTNYDRSQLTLKILSMGNGGDVFVAAVETLDLASPNNDRRMTVWRWNGSWTDLNCPDPTDANIPAGVYEATGENSFWDQLAAMVAARADGPCTDGFTLVYSYRYVNVSTTNFAVETIFYTVGVGWHDEIITYPVDIEGHNRLHQGDINDPATPPHVVDLVDHDVMWHPNLNKLVLAFDLLSNASEEIWDVWQLNDAGDQWELFNVDFPASTAGPWRNSRNTARIGPDGEIYRAMFSESYRSTVVYELKIIKTSPGFNTGFAMAHQNGAGEGATEDGADRWAIFDASTANSAIKFAGGFGYSVWNTYAEGTQYDASGLDTWTGSWADAIYVFKHEFVPCARFFYGSIKRP